MIFTSFSPDSNNESPHSWCLELPRQRWSLEKGVLHRVHQGAQGQGAKVNIGCLSAKQTGTAPIYTIQNHEYHISCIIFDTI